MDQNIAETVINLPSQIELISTLTGLAHDAGRAARNLLGRNRGRLFALRTYTYLVLDSTSAATTSVREDALLLALSRFARKANDIAHDLPEGRRRPVFALKSAALSSLILCGGAIVNDISVDATAGLNLILLPGKRIHCPLAMLTPRARAVAKRQAAFVPVSAALFERINPAQIEGLLRLGGRAA